MASGPWQILKLSAATKGTEVWGFRGGDAARDDGKWRNKIKTFTFTYIGGVFKGFFEFLYPSNKGDDPDFSNAQPYRYCKIRVRLDRF